MKKIFYYMLAAAVTLLSGCYEDKGNYDYHDIGDIAVNVTSDIYDYQVMMGERLSIPMTVATDVPGSELEYMWEIVFGYSRFADFVPGKDMDYVMVPSEVIPTYGTYDLRLKVSRRIDGRVSDVYSPMVKVVVSGEPGLMVLHGSDTESDVGIIQDPDFMITGGSRVTEKVTYDTYSAANGGKIAGKGAFIIQQHNLYGTAQTSNVYIVTDRAALYAAAAGLLKKGDYPDMFYSMPGHDPMCKGKPGQFQFYGTAQTVIDDGDIFCQQGAHLNTKFSVKTEIKDLSDYKASKFSYLNSDSYIFDLTTRGFIGISLSGSGAVSFRSYDSTWGDFNVGDMQADLLFFDAGGTSGHFLGVFRDDTDEMFIGEIDFAARNEPGSTFAHARYDVSRLPGFADSRFHAFGSTSAMCYYATADTIYQYAVLGTSGTTDGRKLMMGAQPAELTGEVTMMKMIRPRVTGGDTYQYHSRMLIVATYEGGKGTLHAFVLDTISGGAISHKKFTGFDRITDANLKTL